MKSTIRKFWIIAALAVFAASCATEEKPVEESLKASLDGKFIMGAALNSLHIDQIDTPAVKLIKQHFNSVVAENVMKSEIIQPEEGLFNFNYADRFVDFGEANDMYIVGHCLIWHSQAPDWFFKNKDGYNVSREVMIERMRTHITELVGRYKGRVDCWDVVNEAFQDDGSWRETMFLKIIGKDYIELAFKFAHEADPKAELLYNDYSMFHEGRRNAAIELAKDLRSKGIQIDGVGMQAHYGLDNLPLKKIEESIVAFADADLDVHITELDISVLPFPDWSVGAEVSASFEYKQKMNPYAEGLPDSVQQVSQKFYKDFFDLMLKHEDKIKRVTTWGVADIDSWKNNWPIRGRTDYPLLFDRNYQAKPVVFDIMKENPIEE